MIMPYLLLAAMNDDTDVAMNDTELQVQTSVAIDDDTNYTYLSSRPEELVPLDCETEWGWNTRIYNTFFCSSSYIYDCK